MDIQTRNETPRAQAARHGDRFAHIDGLRAIAVLAVVFYHAGVPGFGGGFVGVDIFFVISGYLIINHIVDEIGRGSFGLLKFYARRGLRLLPPLFAMLAVSAVLALIILISHYEWEWYGLSTLFASISLANFYFLDKQGYFDIDMYEKPLLHTWSLSVEEQFYLVAPVLLLGCFWLARRLALNPYRLLAVVAALVFVASLVGCVLQTYEVYKNPAFYMTWWRAWEFAAGGAIGYFVTGDRRPAGPALSGVLGVAGLLLSVVPIFLYKHVEAYPAAWPLAPVAGTALLIATGFLAPGSFVSRLLSMRVLGFIGLVSYGWYLWHWPLISFARIADFDAPSLTRDLVMAAISFGLAVATWRWIERPARNWRARHDLDQMGWRIFLTGVAASLMLAVVTGGIGGGMYLYSQNNPANSADSSQFADASACPEPCGQAAGRTGFIVGDSHSDRLYHPFRREAARVGAKVSRRGISSVEEADFAVLIMRWNMRLPLGLDEEIDDIVADWVAKTNGNVLIIAPTPEFDQKGANCVPRAIRYGIDLNRCSKPRAEVEERRRASVAHLKAIADAHPGVRYIDPIDIFCDETTCRPFLGEATLFKDKDHLIVPYGSDFFFHALREEFWPLLRGDPFTDANPS